MPAFPLKKKVKVKIKSKEVVSIRGAREGVSFFSEEKHYSTLKVPQGSVSF